MLITTILSINRRIPAGQTRFNSLFLLNPELYEIAMFD